MSHCYSSYGTITLWISYTGYGTTSCSLAAVHYFRSSTLTPVRLRLKQTFYLLFSLCKFGDWDSLNYIFPFSLWIINSAYSTGVIRKCDWLAIRFCISRLKRFLMAFYVRPFRTRAIWAHFLPTFKKLQSSFKSSSRFHGPLLIRGSR